MSCQLIGGSRQVLEGAQYPPNCAAFQSLLRLCTYRENTEIRAPRGNLQAQLFFRNT